jgi:hypothetical protein
MVRLATELNYVAEIERLETEIARLRAALAKIDAVPWGSATECQKIAREALGK